MRTKGFELQKYINKLKVAKAPVYILGKENGLALQNIKHPAFNETENFPLKLQISEFYGKTNEDHSFLSPEYKSHLLELKAIDEQYSRSKVIEERIKLAKKEFDNWNSFIEGTVLSEEDFKVRQDTLIKLEDIWMRFKVNCLLILEKK